MDMTDRVRIILASSCCIPAYCCHAESGGKKVDVTHSHHGIEHELLAQQAVYKEAFIRFTV